MDVYHQLVKYPVFTIDEVEKLTGNSKTAYYQLEQLMKKGLVKKVRKNIYSVVNLVTGQIVASRYQIACAISDTAYLSHYSAFEFYGLVKQIICQVYVSSQTKFNHFEYEHVIYRYVASRMQEGIVQGKNMPGVQVTDLERTVIDSIHDYNKTGHFEVILNCLEGIHCLDETRLLRYLEVYNTQGLYQRVGYLLQLYQENLQLSNAFFDTCKGKIVRSRRYLINKTEGSIYNREWELMVPAAIFEITKKDGDRLS